MNSTQAVNMVPRCYGNLHGSLHYVNKSYFMLVYLKRAQLGGLAKRGLFTHGEDSAGKLSWGRHRTRQALPPAGVLTVGFPQLADRLWINISKFILLYSKEKGESFCPKTRVNLKKTQHLKRASSLKPQSEGKAMVGAGREEKAGWQPGVRCER